ncbi:glycosyltransferase [Litoribacter alkaliphilus]|uniref:Glycosyltransferase n=1 Tax=Litoribacter ruber TaxID=702568 RepID=A0AAP2G3M9_9BACT|nr:glycosyltransferase [Litoribacter alkaliphilus]MBS9523191.1 glycosyltransferase [Litoribacter alkaliphilus]
MQVLHVISTLNKRSGGPSLSSFTLVKGLQQIGLNIEMLTFAPRDENEKLISEEVFIWKLPYSMFPRWEYSLSAIKFLKYNHKQFDIFHIHGLWEFLPHAAARQAMKTNKPFVFTLRGMLYPSALNHSKAVKTVASMLFQNKDLASAAVLHATCEEEYKVIRSLNFKNPVAIIPNPISLPPEYKTLKEKCREKVRFGFVGRLNFIKNIEGLIFSWRLLMNELDEESVELVIVGNGDNKYKRKLTSLVAKEKLKNIIFSGFLDGEEKDEMISSFHYLLLPSKSENFGMVVTEALSKGVPVIASKGTPWEDLETFGCGWWVDNEPSNIKSYILKAYHQKEAERIQMGISGQKLVRNKYSQAAVADNMKDLYNWVMNKETIPPAFVKLH